MAETSLTALAIGFKFLFYLSSMQACGAALLLILFSSELASQTNTCTRQMRKWAVLCALSSVGFVTIICMPLFQIGGLGLVTDYLKTTGYAAAVAVQLLACAGLLVGGIVAAIASVFLLGSFALVGHIGPSFFANALVFHLIIGAIWLAVLAPLHRMALMPDIHPAAVLGRAFGRLAQGFVPVSFILGALLAWSVSSSVSDLIRTPYGWVLIGKVLCSSGLLWAGALNKLRLVPAIEAGDPTAARRLATTLRIEQGLFIVILGLTAVLTTNLTPP